MMGFWERHWTMRLQQERHTRRAYLIEAMVCIRYARQQLREGNGDRAAQLFRFAAGYRRMARSASARARSAWLAAESERGRHIPLEQADRVANNVVRGSVLGPW